MPTTSLCMIAGREAPHIVRCLASFAPAFDELCLVSATGNQPDDGTHDMAREWCGKNGKAFRGGVYRNADENNWPHVDDFAAARNQSFSLATGDWLFWVDCDDVTDDAEKIRSILDSATVDVLFFPYDVPGTNKCPMRERVISRKLWNAGRRWRSAIHENLAVMPEDSALRSNEAVWRHAPLGVKPRSHERNLRILGAELAGAASSLFYAHSEHVYAGSNVKARELGLAALAMPTLADSFRFEVMMNMGRTCADTREAIDWFAKAAAFAPNLREPLAGLALSYLSLGDSLRAYRCTEAMIRVPEPAPDDRLWTHESKWYGWAATDLWERVQRLRGITPTARPARVSLLHATRGRTQAAWTCRERWLSTAIRPDLVEHILAVDDDDAKSVEFARQFKSSVVAAGGGCVRAWNAAAKLATADIFIQLSDDWTPSYGWDAAIVAAIGDTKQAAVLAVGDGHRRDALLCMAILTRARWEGQGREVFASEYKSMFSDNEFSHRAWRDGVVIDKRAEITFEHAHPFFTGAPMDETYKATNAPERYAEGEATFKRRNPDA